ncbi:DNA-binding domain-containing protein [Marinomonas sp. THO17]|uniref:HvfC/BufC N-terminal domain-containing protein n=1 Tax=Marinomonas sp. THO17 TaxID=3149048 RepID=UPI00336C0D40
MQADFIQAILTQDANSLQPYLRGNQEDNAIRFKVYQNNIIVSLQDALSDIFPLTLKLVGTDFFRAMARAYLLKYPPNTPIISEYGASFAEFISDFEPAKNLGFLAPMASLEYQLLQLTNAEECAPLDHQTLTTFLEQTVHPEQICIELTVNTQLLHAPFALGSLFLACQQDTPLNTLEMDKSEYLLLHKSFIYAKMNIISYEEANFIKALQNKLPLSQAIPESNDFDLGQTLAKLIEWQLITKLTLNTN